VLIPVRYAASWLAEARRRGGSRRLQPGRKRAVTGLHGPEQRTVRDSQLRPCMLGAAAVQDGNAAPRAISFSAS
jgi:hypothetical protein